MDVIWHSAGGQKRDVMIVRDRCKKCVEPFLQLRPDQSLSILGAVDRMNVVLAIGMTHPNPRTSGTKRCRTYGAQFFLTAGPQPFRAGLRSGNTPTGLAAIPDLIMRDPDDLNVWIKAA